MCTNCKIGGRGRNWKVLQHAADVNGIEKCGFAPWGLGLVITTVHAYILQGKASGKRLEALPFSQLDIRSYFRVFTYVQQLSVFLSYPNTTNSYAFCCVISSGN